MKQLPLYLVILICLSTAANNLSTPSRSTMIAAIPAKDDKAFLLQQFEDTKAQLLKDVAGLNEEQLNFKSAPDRWSIRECLEHIVTAEKEMFSAEQQLVKQPANPERRKDIKVKDDELLKMINDRSHKAKAPEKLQPKGTYATGAEAISAFTEQRDKGINYVKTTQDDLRNHVMDSPGGPIDAYQFLLAIAGHCSRHTKQIEEVKADPAFPKS